MKKISVGICLAFLGASQASGQTVPVFATMAMNRPQAMVACPLAEYTTPPLPPGSKPPFFDFNGTYKTASGQAIPGFTCQVIGPFQLNGKAWYVQNVRGLQPSNAPTPSTRVNNVRICSGWAKELLAKPVPPNQPPPVITGPFSGRVGPKGCELLWAETVQ